MLVYFDARGILICWEGVWPLTPGGNWSQPDELVLAQQATKIIWSIGGAIPSEIGAEVYTER